jgi:hypothetical protein
MGSHLQKELIYQKKKLVAEDTVKTYISKAASEGISPLPVLNRINEHGELFLVRYHIN